MTTLPTYNSRAPLSRNACSAVLVSIVHTASPDMFLGQAAAPAAAPKLVLYSAHDWTIMPIQGYLAHTKLPPPI